jgi:hypothetical protein
VNYFLESVLPTQDLYCVVGIRAGRVRASFHDNLDDVDAVANGLDASGVDAYFALASFKDAVPGRKADNATYLRSFFLDLDCGTGKPYRDQAHAAQELSVFVQTTGLPSPMVVNSGGGIHVYWPLTEDIPVADWVPLAKSLKALCREHKLFADPAVTADAARILRIPGTHNFKTNVARGVQIITTGQPSPLSAITSCLPAPAVDLSAAKAFGMDDASRDLAGGEYPVCNFKKIVIMSVSSEAGCGQIKKAVEEAATLEEPLWRAVLSIANRCEDREMAIHTVSKGHPEYTPEATEAKAAETKGPYTCEWYRDNNPTNCEGCKHRITSPIILGKVIQMATTNIVEVTSAPNNVGYVVEEDKDGDAGGPRILVEIPPMPSGYQRGAKGGVYATVEDEDGIEKPVLLYDRDLYITERFFDSDEHGDGDGEVACIRLHMQHDGVRQFYSPVADIFSKDKLRDTLIKNGVVAYGKTLDLIMAYFASSLRSLQAKIAANKTRSQMGWTANMESFVVGELEYTPRGTKLAPPASGTRQLAPAFIPRGTLENWKKMADFYNTPGLEAHALALFFGFGAPLLKFIGGTAVTGAVVHLKSNASGSGKTTAQLLVNSIFGNPTELLMTKDDTYASKMHRIGMMNSIAFTMDEITNTEDKELSDTAYGLTTGRARHRMDASSNKMRANNTTFCTITITSSNASMVDKLAQLKSTADGELRRVLEIEVPKIHSLPKAEIDALFGLMAENYGTAGPIFIQYVVCNRDEVLEMLKQMQARIDKDLALDQADRFYSCILTCAFVGAAIAAKCGILSIDIPRIYQYAIGLVDSNKVAQLSSVGDPLTVAQETLSAFINENVNNALVINSSGKGTLPQAPIIAPRGALRMRYEPDTKELFITSSEFRSFFTKRQVDVREALNHLAAGGIVKFNGRAESKRIGAGAVGGMAGLNVRCYVFDGKAMGIDATSFQSNAQASTP